MSDGKEPRGFAGLASLASDLEEEAERQQAEETDAREGPPSTARETTEVDAGDATAHDRAHEEDDASGFSALSALASEGTAEERTTTPRTRAIDRDTSRTDSPAGEPSDTARPKTTARPAQQSGEHARPDRSEPPRPPQKHSSMGIWIGLVGLVLIGALVFYPSHETRKDDRSAAGNVSGTPEVARSAAGQAPAPQRKESLSDLTFSKPQVGSNNVLKVAELRWCLRKSIRIETLRPLPTTNAQINEFNALVSDYNRRCGNVRYREGALTRARREVERHRNEIVARVSTPWEGRRTQTDGGTSERGSEPAMDGRGEATLTKERAFEALRQSDPKYKDYSDDELAKWLNQAYGPDWLKVLTAKLETMGQGTSADQEKRTEAEAPTTAPGRGTAHGGPAPPSPGVTEQAPNVGEPTAASPSRSREAPQEATNPASDPPRQASLDRDSVQVRLQEGERKAEDRRAEQVEQTEPAETTRPPKIEEGDVQREATEGEEASDEAANAEGAHIRMDPEQKVQPEATRTQESDDDPPSSRRQLIREIQTHLMALGYEPGPIDGLYGRRTKGAIEAFERDIGMTPTGEATIGLWRKVRRGVKPRTGLPPRRESTDPTRESGGASRGDGGAPQGASDASSAAPGSERTTQERSREQHSSAAGASHFTMGSHADDVRRVQGEPDAVTRYDASGRMTWRYGSSTVEIATPSNRVRQWGRTSGTSTSGCTRVRDRGRLGRPGARG